MKFYIKNLISIFLIPTLILANGEGIILSNKSGASLICEKDTFNNSLEIVLKNNDSLFLGNIGEDMIVSIKSIGEKPLEQDLSHLISSISTEYLLYPNRNAIITIYFKSLFNQWSIDVSWEYFDIYKIIKPILGEDFAQKAKDIELYDYSKAVAAGFINLFNVLSQEVNNINLPIYEKSSRRKEPWIAPDPTTIEELKSSINLLHRALEKYKIRENKI